MTVPTLVTAGTEGSAASGNVTPGKPAGITANDVLICAWHQSGSNAGTMATSWTLVTQSGISTSRISVWWHRTTSTAGPASTTITLTSGHTPIAGIAAFRNCLVSASPIHKVGARTSATGGTNLTHAGVTTTASDCLQLLINGAADDNARTLLTGFTNVFEDTAGGTQNSYQATAGTPDGSVSMFYKALGAAGTVSNAVVVQAASDPWSTIMIALRGLAAATGVFGMTALADRHYRGMV